jgi:hypothetical protein
MVDIHIQTLLLIIKPTIYHVEQQFTNHTPLYV